MLSACGASKGTADYSTSSRLLTTDVASIDTSTRPLAYCNQATSSTLSYNTSTYQDGESIDPNRINLKITKIPSAFSSNANYIEFHKYMVNSSGNKMWGESRLSMNLYSIADGKLLASGKTSLYWRDLTSAASKLGVSTPDQFFKKTRIVIQLVDPNADYDAISAIYYNSSDNSTVSQLDSLIPAFDADPARYATDKDGTTRHSTLQVLHPFKAYAGQWSAQIFQTKAGEFCSTIYTAQ
tara:strand:+ start:22844 stop:23560 length:717 start_codon:yes stop_codon:yes gene_type:complete